MTLHDRQPPQMQAARRVAKNSGFLLLSKILEILATLATTAVTARYLGVDSFGMFVMTTAVSMALVPLADFGVERIVSREIARDATNAAAFVSNTLFLRSVFSLMILFTAFLVLRASAGPGVDYTTIFILSIAADLVWSLGMTYLSVVRAFERMEFELFITVGYKLLSLGLVVAISVFDLGFQSIFWSRLLTAALFTALCAALVYRKFVGFACGADKGVIRFIIKESYPLAIASLFIGLIFRVDVFVLNWLGTVGDIALFEVSNRQIMQIQLIPLTFSLALFPVMTRSTEKGAESTLALYYQNAHKLLLLFSVPIAVLLVVAGKPFIIILFGREFAQASVALVIMAPTIVFLFLLSLQNLFLTAVNRQALNTATTGIALGLNFLIDVLLIPRFGYLGASVAKLISFFAIFALNASLVARYGITLSQAPLALKAAAAGIVATAAVFIQTGVDSIDLITRSVAAVSLYAVVMLALKGVTRDDFETVMNVIGRRRKAPPEMQRSA